MPAEEKKNGETSSESQKNDKKKGRSLIEDEKPQLERRKEIATQIYDFEADWERIFVANIEFEKTVPYISLLKFKFMQIDFERYEMTEPSERGSDRESEVKKTTSSKIYAHYLKVIFGEDIKARRRKKIEEIFNVDDGPSISNYNPQLGLEFWSSYCNVEKNVLKQSVASGFWEKREDSYRDLKEKLTQMMNERQKGFLKRLWNLFDSSIIFFKGSYEPVRAPQKVLSPEERFRVQSLAKIKKASEDIIPPKEYKTFTEKIVKQILKMYKWVVDLWGGKWPRIRKPTLEEVYDDILIWILDLKRSKERIQAILNDRIKKEII